MLPRLIRAPALHFLLLGGALFALASRLDGERPGGGRRVVLAAEDVERLRDEWAREHGTRPGPAAEKALLREAIDEEILYREALALGLDHQDGVVRQRLVRLAGFLSEDAGRGEDILEREARRLGLERSDLVIRRHLVQMMRLAAGRLRPSDLPSEAELEAYLERHAERFAQPARVRLTHVYLSGDRRGPALEVEAARLLDELRRTGAGPAAAASLGDAFIRGPHVGPATGSDLERMFGPEFAHAVEGAAPGTWLGPVRSSYGLHLVWVHERLPGGAPPLAAVRNQVLHRVLEERSGERLRAWLEAARQRYEIGIAF